MEEVRELPHSSPFKKPWTWFKELDIFIKLYLITMLLVLLSIPFIISQETNISTHAINGGLPGWANRVQLTIDHTKIASSLSDFPVLLNLSSASGINRIDASPLFNTIGNDSEKIAVTTSDGTTECNVEVVKWDASARQATLWVKVPNISSSSDTVLYLYYDNAQPDNTTHVGGVGSHAGQQVWTNGYAAVWHLSENGGPYVDSTGKGHTGTAMSAPQRENSPLGYKQEFNFGNWIRVDNAADLSRDYTGNMSFTWWLNVPEGCNMSDDSDWTQMLSKGTASGNDEFQWGMGGVSSCAAGENTSHKGKEWELFMYWAPPDGSGDQQPGIGGYKKYHAGDWIYLTAAMDSTYGYYHGYFPDYDGSLADWGTYDRYTYDREGPGDYAYNGVPNNHGAPMTFGTFGQRDWFQGGMAEIRFANVIQSEAWKKADYYSGIDKLLTYGDFGNNPTSVPYPTNVPTSAPTSTPTPGNTFGLNSGDSVYDSSYFNAQRFQNTVGNGTLTKLEILVNDSAPTGNVRLGVYSDNNGAPGNLLLDAGSTPLSNGWVGISGLNLPVAKGAYYWLAFLNQNPTGISYQSGMSAGSHIDYGYTYGALPASFGASDQDVDNEPYVLRATVSNIVTPSNTPRPTPTKTPTATSVPPTAAPTVTPAVRPTNTPMPSQTPTRTPTPTPNPTPKPTNTPVPTLAPTSKPTSSPTAIVTSFPTIKPTPRPTPTPTPARPWWWYFWRFFSHR
jgi:hypothetical protein